MTKEQTITDLIKDGIDLLGDLPEEMCDLVYWAASLDDEARAALIMAYRILKDEG